MTIYSTDDAVTHSWLGHALLTLLTETISREELQTFLNEHNRKFDVQVTINGRTVEFDHLIKNLSEQYEDQVKKEASAFARRLMGEKEYKLLEMINKVTTEFEYNLRSLGLNSEDEY